MRMMMMLALVACSAPSTPATFDASPAHDGHVEPDGLAPTATCVGKAPQPVDATWTVMVGGVARTAGVHVPASYDPTRPTPLVLNLHGRTGWGSQQASLSHAIAKSNSAGFIVVHPESVTSPTSWNAGGGCCDPAASNDVDDSGFMRALLDEAEARLCVDADRVYAMGLSNGGYLAHRMACELSDRIAAIGAVAGLLSLPSCAPTRPVPVMLTHGTADEIVLYSWVPATVDFWKGTNSCTTVQTTYQNGDAKCVTHGGCTAGADVVLCTIEDGGHQWPGGEALPFLGHKSDDLNATDAMWEFFLAHPAR